MEGRLRNIMAEFESAWNDNAIKPQWRIDQEMSPSKWNVRVISNEDHNLKWMSKIAFTKFRLVGVDVERQQKNNALPYPAITSGNDNQDRNCENARLLPAPIAIKIQSGARLHIYANMGTWLLGPSTNDIIHL